MAEVQDFQSDAQLNSSSASSNMPVTVAMSPEIASWTEKTDISSRPSEAEEHHLPQQKALNGDSDTLGLTNIAGQGHENPEAETHASEITNSKGDEADDADMLDDSTSTTDSDADDSQSEFLDSGSKIGDSSQTNEDVSSDEEDTEQSYLPLSVAETSDPLADIRSQNRKRLDFLAKISEKIKHKTDLEPWTKEISKLGERDTAPKVIIAMVGQTGAGKSSLVNALLDVERVIPTSCSRACTAIITEIAWDRNSKSPFRAEFEFLSVQEWQDEVSILLEDLKDRSGGIQGPDSAAAIALAKMRAVYPSLSNEKLSKMSADEVVAHGNIGQKLGQTINITANDPKTFYKQIQTFVDSKSHLDKARDGGKGSLWPIIRVGRIFMWSEVLSTGAVLVDLPGVYDCNAARRVIAMNYLARASIVCIVSNSKRAVNDKCASDLLGESLKRHLHFGGSFDRTIWVNTHIDDVNPEEIELELGTSELEELREEMKAAEKQKTDSERKLQGKRKSRDNAQTSHEASRKQITTLKKLAKQQEKGMVVYDPVFGKNGRRRRGQQTPIQPAIPITKDEIESKINEATTAQDRYAFNVNKLSRKIKELEAHVGKKAAEIDDRKQRGWQIALEARNESLVQGIKDNFVATVQEFDEEALRNADEVGGETNGETRGYDKLRDNFAVFCTSSKGYQKEMGRMKNDSTFMCFKDPKETGIPDLRAHIIQVAGNVQHAACEHFRSLILSIVISLRLWAIGNDGGKELSPKDLENAKKMVARRFKKLDKGIVTAIEAAGLDVKNDVVQKIYFKLEDVLKNAKQKADKIQEHWGSSPNRESRSKGGLYWGEYKATVRRRGEYSNKNRECDFNQDLWNSVLDSIAHNWDQILRVDIEVYFHQQTEQCDKILQDFHDSFQFRALGLRLNPKILQLLKQQLPERKELIRNVLQDAKDTILQGKSFAYRAPVDSVKASMTKNYAKIAGFTGKGSFKAMRERMEKHVKTNKHKMFTSALDVFKMKFDEYLNHALHEMHARVREYMNQIHKDYEGTFSRQTKSFDESDDVLGKEILAMIESSGLFNSLEDALKTVCKQEDDEEANFKVKLETSPA